MADDTSRVFTGYLLLDWKKRTMKVLNRKPKDVGPYVVPIKVNITVSMPPVKELEAKGEVELTSSKVKEFVIEGL